MIYFRNNNPGKSDFLNELKDFYRETPLEILKRTNNYNITNNTYNLLLNNNKTLIYIDKVFLDDEKQINKSQNKKLYLNNKFLQELIYIDNNQIKYKSGIFHFSINNKEYVTGEIINTDIPIPKTNNNEIHSNSKIIKNMDIDKKQIFYLLIFGIIMYIGLKI